MEGNHIKGEGENKKEEIEKFLKEIDDKKKKGDTHSYKGWMNSNSFLKRSIGVFLYATLGYILTILIISAIILIAVYLFGVSLDSP